MLSPDGKHLHISEEHYNALIERLALKVYDSAWEFDQILCLARGGMRPGDILSRIFNKPLSIISTSSYRAKGGTEQSNLNIADYITTPDGEISGRVLLVDDLADSGHTLVEVVKKIRAQYTRITDMRTAVLWLKAISTHTPDYYVEHLPTNPWIHQPFEIFDGIDIEEFKRRQGG